MTERFILFFMSISLIRLKEIDERKPAKGLAPWNPSAALTLNVSAGGFSKLNETRAHP